MYMKNVFGRIFVFGPKITNSILMLIFGMKNSNILKIKADRYACKALKNEGLDWCNFDFDDESPLMI